MAPNDENTSNEPGTETPQAAAAPGLGLLFQAPEPVAAPPRRAPKDDAPDPQDRDDEPSSRGEQDDDGDGQGGGRRRRRGGRGRNRGDDDGGRDDGDQDSGQDQGARGGSAKGGSGKGASGKGGSGKGGSAQDAEEDKGADSSGSSKGGSGKGGKGKKKSGQGSGGGAADQGSAADDAGDSGDDQPADEQGSDSGDDGDGEGGSRRRRRRRRGGGGGGGGQDDPPGTVTKVREGRKERDEPKAIKGSTRLEAKKQRRREGREAGRRRTIITEAEFLARRESVERVMVVRQQEERTQIGVLEDDILVEHYVSRETTSTMVGNVYLGRVQNVLPSMEAAFVDIGKGRNAVLYAGEVNWEAQGVGNGQARRIENALSSGDSVLVQVTKDPIGHKGARLTSQISLPGRYLVYVPEGSMTGISRKLPDTERARLKSILKEVVPDSAGVIVRTAAEGASEEELRRDVQRLTSAWDKLSAKAEQKKEKKASAGGAPTLLHAEPDMTVRVIRDIFNEDFASMVVQGETAWQQIKSYVGEVAPDLADRISRFTGEGDVFAEHRIDEAIAKAMDRKVWLPSGGSLVIDRTEAMTVVDVNTGKFTGSGGNLEETVTKNNLEAAEEIVRQLRLRDIGGIIVVDFIDMVLESNRDLVVRRLLECLGRDRTKHQVAEVTSLGLVQMTRKRVGSGLIEVFSEPCEHCGGRGIVVHSEPVEHHHSGGGNGGNGGGSNSGGGRGRGGRKGGRSKGNDQAEAPEPNGPSAAQIAAAAHAAAVKSIAGESSEDDVAELPAVAEIDGDEDTAATSEVESPQEETVADEIASDSGEVDLAPEDADDEPVTAGQDEQRSEEPAAAAQPTAETSRAPEPASAPRRRGGRRGASSSGTAVSLQPVDLTASTSGGQTLTTVAAESGDAATAPTADPEPSAPARRKRKRVTAQAGPPKADETDQG
ncbi:hypothetical protein GCM10027055_13400 [Janibacter alkaliphilus]|uniref:Ribonuclease E n=1 Tax=Janibacter alkaliphilus TaxID=1069963 RepID=A0A852X452_9MICO|nr:Rne/Rng family ribonuclease [Janibacter alkaliphilus]NYG37669.1 ribonuclease E [Janibacter alkaliphilus]